MKFPAVAVALSGGIDSLVSAFLLKNQTSNIFGIHFSTGYEKGENDLSRLEKQLGFPIFQVDLKALFEKEVVNYFTSSYLKAQTPNPCLVCNVRIKFGALAAEARRLGADVLATGHYARVVNAFSCPDREISRPWLEKGADRKKDQSYFLARLNRDQLDRILFPLAEYTKTEVRQIARENHLIPATPAESQDICFIHENKFSDFILKKTKIAPCPGEIRDESGQVIGTHDGLYSFTVGQRRGINCPGPEPFYVKRIDPVTNTLHVCFKHELVQNRMQVKDLLWNSDEFPEEVRVKTKIRYSHKEALSWLKIDNKDTKISANSSISGQVIFDDPQGAVTPGQAAVFYEEERVLGSAIIQ